MGLKGEFLMRGIKLVVLYWDAAKVHHSDNERDLEVRSSPMLVEVVSFVSIPYQSFSNSTSPRPNMEFCLINIPNHSL